MCHDPELDRDAVVLLYELRKIRLLLAVDNPKIDTQQIFELWDSVKQLRQILGIPEEKRLDDE